MKRRPSFMLLVGAVVWSLAVFVASGCVKKVAAIETTPLTDNLGAYWTCAVAFSSDGRGADANEAFTFVPWFEGRVRERGVFDPLARDEGAEAEVTLRLEASQSEGGDHEDRVNLHVSVVDTRSHAVLGELEATGAVDAPADAGTDASESRRMLALRSAAEQILDTLQQKRRASMAKAHHAPTLAAPPPLPNGPPVAGMAVCSTQCVAPASTSSSHEEQYRVSAGVNATMKDLRECLDRVGAQLVVPAVLLRFSPDGRLRHMRVDVGGYEHLECIQQIPVAAAAQRVDVARQPPPVRIPLHRVLTLHTC